MGTALRFNFLTNFQNLRPNSASLNLCVFKCSPQLRKNRKLFKVSILERHPLSSQAFVPISGTRRYLIIVCLGEDRPDLSTLKAFIATGSQGISYNPGVWHHPIVALDKVTEFSCLVWEDSTSNDCDIIKLTNDFFIKI